MKKRVGLLICTAMLMGSESQAGPLDVFKSKASQIASKASNKVLDVINSETAQNIKNSPFVQSTLALAEEQLLSGLPPQLRQLITNPNARQAIIAMAANPKNARKELDELMKKEPALATSFEQLMARINAEITAQIGPTAQMINDALVTTAKGLAGKIRTQGEMINFMNGLAREAGRLKQELPNMIDDPDKYKTSAETINTYIEAHSLINQLYESLDPDKINNSTDIRNLINNTLNSTNIITQKLNETAYGPKWQEISQTLQNLGQYLNAAFESRGTEDINAAQNQQYAETAA